MQGDAMRFRSSAGRNYHGHHYTSDVVTSKVAQALIKMMRARFPAQRGDKFIAMIIFARCDMKMRTRYDTLLKR